MPCSTSLAGSTLAYTVRAGRLALRAVTTAVIICVKLRQSCESSVQKKEAKEHAHDEAAKTKDHIHGFADGAVAAHVVMMPTPAEAEHAAKVKV
jgi:ABC-type Zn2+ transport system substrate-binding protein/surface adhesin